MSFYSLTSYSQLRVNQSALGGGSIPPFSNVYSFDFDGVDDKFASNNNYTELNGSTNASISFWIKPLNSSNQFVWRFGKTSGNQRLGCVWRGNGSIDLSVDTGSYFFRTAVGSVPLNQWTHICWTFDGSLSRYLKTNIYVNGVRSVSVNAGSVLSSLSYNALLEIAGSGTSFGNFKLDEMGVWNGTTLTEAQSLEIYNSQVPNDLNNLPTAPQPTTWLRQGDSSTWNGSVWTMNDVNGSTVLTSSNMVEANRTTDVPPNPFTNTLSTLFDGVDDSVSLVSDILLGTTSSVSFWIKRNDTAIAQPLGCVTAWSDFLVRLQTTQISFGRVPFIFNNATTLSTINQTTDWTHLLFVRTGATCNLYVNGVDNDGAKTNANASWINKFRVIGAPGDGTTWAFNGLIDEVSLFTTALSSSDATAIYNGGLPTSLTSYSPLGWWRMGDGSTYPTINDIGSGGSNGTMNNMSASNFVTDVPT